MIGALDLRQDLRRAMLEAGGRVLRPLGASAVARERILVVRPDHLGDLLFLTPALRRLRRGFPRAEIVALVGSWGVPVLERNANLDRLIPWEFPWFDRKPRRSTLDPYLSLLRLARVLRAARFDVAIQFRADFWWGALAGRLAGIPEQLGYDVPAVRSYLTTRLPLKHGSHVADENLALAEAMTGIGGHDPLEFTIDADERRRADKLLGALRDGRPLVALQVGAGARVKLWPGARLAEVGRVLRDRFDVGVVVIGGTNEVVQVQEVQQGVGPAAIGLAGTTTLGELAAVLERCALVVGPDSGPLHLAVAVGTPTVHLFGPADARRFGPYGDPRRHLVISSPWPCAPCNRLAFPVSELAEHSCLSEISVDQVVDACATLLDLAPDRRAAE